MKAKNRSMNNWKYHQRSLINDETIIEAKEVMTNNDINIFEVYHCLKHKFEFFRHKQLNYGYCWYCKFEINATDKCEVEDMKGKRLISIYPLQEFHIIYSDSIRESTKLESESMKAEFTTRIEDGKYNGKIIGIEERTEPYEYTDFVVSFVINKKELQIKYGCPTNLTYDEKTKKPTSKLAMVLDEFGFKVDFEKEITLNDLEKHFIGKSITSLIANEKSKAGGTYATMKTMTPKL
jgi:hypothetical protein